MTADHHEGQRVSRRTLVRGVGALSFAGLLAACTGDDQGGPGATQAAPGATQASPGGAGPAASSASTTADLTGLFDGAGTCQMSPSATQGPYYFDADKIRSDIREDRPGTRLRVVLKAQDSASCRPLGNAVVEIWHCDAAGLYSGAEAMSAGGGAGLPRGGGDLKPADDKRYLRGAQVSNADGIVQFTTIWPGWYRGRTIHIHVMLHVNDRRVLTSQLMFDEALNTKVLSGPAYAKHTGRDTTNDNDSIFRRPMLMKVTEDADGYLAVLALSAAV
jgi:protocatechuate 3,4-dioxygenase beta subunit